MQRHWTLDDIPWDRFDPAKVDPGILQAVKAAALVEYNATDYVAYLCNVFSDDAEFQATACRWGEEEVQHGLALARWAKLADPAYDFERALARFLENFRVDLGATRSIRGSRAGELIARCVVECGTSSFYSAIRDATDEPVLKAVAHRIAGDEFRHYKLFYDGVRRHQERERLTLLRRLAVAFGRINEASDDELAIAFWSGNDLREAYDRTRHSAAYALRAGRLYRYGHIQRALGMVLKACDVAPQGRFSRILAWAAWKGLQYRNRRLARIAA